MVAVGRRLNGIILAGLPPAEVAAAERALETMKENIRGAIAEKDEVELPVGVFAPDEAERAPVQPRRTPHKLRKLRGGAALT